MKTDIGHYQLVSELGRGGMGVVYKAYEPALERYVAIKELSSSLSHDPDLVQRFVREARAMAALNDPHIIQIHFIGQDEEQPYFAMEFVDGESLSSLLQREGRLKAGDALKICQQAAQGLAAAHSHGVIHRDIKPSNLMLNKRDQLKIADFGIAFTHRDFSKKLTATGDVVGTPGYLSPEVCLGNPVDARSDLFALGIVLYEMLSGQIPFNDPSPLKLMLSVVESAMPDIRMLNNEIDADTVAILDKLLAKNPDNRYQTADDLLKAISMHPDVIDQNLSVHAHLPAGAASTMLATPSLAKAPAGKHQEKTSSPTINIIRPTKSSKIQILSGLAIVTLVFVVGTLWFNGKVTPKASMQETKSTKKEPSTLPVVVDQTEVLVPAEPNSKTMTVQSGIQNIPVQQSVSADPKEIIRTIPTKPDLPAKAKSQLMEKYGEVYVGPHNEEVSVAKVANEDIAYIKATGVNSPFDGKVVRVVPLAAGYEGKDYTMQYEGSDYVVLVKRKYSGRDVQVELYLPGLSSEVKLTYDSDLSKKLIADSLRDDYELHK